MGELGVAEVVIVKRGHQLSLLLLCCARLDSPYHGGLPSTRQLELVSAKPLRCGAVAMHYRRAPGG